jgi:hypothetical protein
VCLTLVNSQTFVYSLHMNGHQALVDEAIELYNSLGHTVEQVAEIDELRSDLLIQSSNREKWVARCDSNSQVSAGSVKLFLTHLATYQAKKAAIITTGALTSRAKKLIVGKPIEFIDSATLASFRDKIEGKTGPLGGAGGSFIEPESEWPQKGGRRGWRRWVRPVLFGLLILAVVLSCVLLAWYGLLPI